MKQIDQLYTEQVQFLSDEVTAGILNELALQAENTILVEKLDYLSQKINLSTRSPQDTSMNIPSRQTRTNAAANCDSSRNSCDLAESKMIRGFDSIASKTFNQCSEDAFVEVSYDLI